MRIIKLSTDEFPELEDVRTYFESTLRDEARMGKFRITDRRIAQKGLRPGEALLFSYQGMVYYIARAASGRLENRDKYQNNYPYYFQVNLDTLRPVEFSLYDIQDQFQQQTGETKSLVQTQGWPKLEDSSFTENLWRSLEGA